MDSKGSLPCIQQPSKDEPSTSCITPPSALNGDYMQAYAYTWSLLGMVSQVEKWEGSRIEFFFPPASMGLLRTLIVRSDDPCR